MNDLFSIGQDKTIFLKKLSISWTISLLFLIIKLITISIIQTFYAKPNLQIIIVSALILIIGIIILVLMRIMICQTKKNNVKMISFLNKLSNILNISHLVYFFVFQEMVASLLLIIVLNYRLLTIRY